MEEHAISDVDTAVLEFRELVKQKQSEGKTREVATCEVTADILRRLRESGIWQLQETE